MSKSATALNSVIHLQPQIMPLPADLPDFEQTIIQHKARIRRNRVRIFQINIGKKCDLACHHCHVEAGPKNPDNMVGDTVDRVIELLTNAPDMEILDITGGAPELNPHFRRLATAARNAGKIVYDRCNLTVLFQPEQEDTPEFLAANGITIIASLPCYTEDNVEEQRGRGVFDKSIKGLQRLNALGYGKAGSGLELNLVYNPVGAHLPPSQAQLEADYRAYLDKHFSIVFNSLFTITNMPIKRYRHYLEREGMLENYMLLLVENFNAAAAAGVMCADTLSVGWDGKLYDCDFNQMLDIPINGNPTTLWDIQSLNDIPTGIAFDNHCYGCTAGAGSSCSGALL
ncbi:arsenosugar biosynthesis radical SAM protein ArsS [Candidatus Persebacteraceae bacterium Df01]|uniref:Arsenosugar biosynthesis radical SAM protein ArsS n=1 Tax=Candidatus Doriopsillibacter californiensis TaxID=2970740 RepID=A0ABT7QL36_9GAMM|nr:arsenosugar biosynthesis radical SAM protein ArsS [Candidatus Persebacteraceae bacterium Df01]